MPNLSGQDLTEICTEHFHTQPLFRGIYASDKLPSPSQLLPSSPCFIIVNTDPSYEPGLHWISIFIENVDSATYFCSLGTPPIEPVRNFLSTIGNTAICKGNWQTNDSDLCGEYCLFFTDLKCQNINNDEIASLFDVGGPILNDHIVSQYVYGHMTI